MPRARRYERPIIPNTIRLTVEQVIEARLRYMWGERHISPMAREFKVPTELLRKAVEGATYKFVPMPPKERSGWRW